MNKKLKWALVALLGLALSGSSFADRGWGYGYSGQRGGHRHGGHHHAGDWIAPLVVLGIGAATIAAVTPRPRPAPPPVVYVPPQLPVGGAYYCGSVGRYYPDTPYCPEGWQWVR